MRCCELSFCITYTICPVGLATIRLSLRALSRISCKPGEDQLSMVDLLRTSFYWEYSAAHSTIWYLLQLILCFLGLVRRSSKVLLNKGSKVFEIPLAAVFLRLRVQMYMACTLYLPPFLPFRHSCKCWEWGSRWHHEHCRAPCWHSRRRCSPRARSSPQHCLREGLSQDRVTRSNDSIFVSTIKTSSNLCISRQGSPR